MFGLSSNGIRELLAHQNGSKRTKRVRLSRRFRQRLFWRDNGICQLCEQPVAFDKSTFDHVHPLTRGGKNRAKENIILTHRQCNDTKGPLLLQDLDDLSPAALWVKFQRTTETAQKIKGHYPDWIAAH